jgi:enoyl-CoA hydratase/carnithine racemase
MREKVNYEISNNIAVVTLNNPPVNALDAVLIKELNDVIAELDNIDDLRAVIITGAGKKIFVAGADISQFIGMKKEDGIEFVRKQQKLFQRIEDFGIPVICAMNGAAMGGGLELALACDIRIVSDRAKMALPEVSLGIIPGIGGTQRLSRTVGMSKAKMMIFSGEVIKADEALRTGIATKVVEAGTTLEESIKLAELIMNNAPLAVNMAKYAMRRGIEMSIVDGVELEAQCFGELCETEDKEEGAKAFLEKRKPNFLGK